MAVTFEDFETQGFPAISIIMMVITTVLAAFKAKQAGQLAMPNTGKGLFVISILMIVASIFMIFGAEQLRSIAIQLFICGIIGTFGSMSRNVAALPVYLFFTAFTFLCMIGSLAVFSHASLVSDVSKADCNGYFGATTPLDRCDGYLEFLWILSTFMIYVVGLAVVLAFASYYTENGAENNDNNKQQPQQNNAQAEP